MPVRDRPGITPGMALLPLRLFLGATFVYGGLQKLSDPGYLHPGAPTYIGTQLHNFANGTPGGFLLRTFALPNPKLAGVGVALLEIAIGLLALTGLATRAAAGVGLLLNLLLFLTNSWKTYPYFLGSDIVFVFAWLPFLLSGATGQPALDNQLARLPARRRSRTPPSPSREPLHAPPSAPEITRRDVLARAISVTGVAALGLGGIAALLKGPYRSHTRVLSAGAHSGSSTTPVPSQPQVLAPPTSSSLPSGAVRIGSSSQLPVGQSAIYNDPSTGEPDILIRQNDGTLTALSAVCTHQGCTVGYSGGPQIICPCHGGTFNARTGAVEGGPPESPLAPRHVREQGGEIYALPA